MKKFLFTTAICLTACAVLSGCGKKGPASGTDGSADTNVSETMAPDIADSVSEKEAKQIAFEDAGVDEADVSDLTIEKDMETFGEVYDIEFYANGAEYDYEIKANSGEINSVDRDAERITGKTPQGAAPAANQNAQDNDTGISSDEAKVIALDQAGIAESDTQGLHVKQDYDDGVRTYDVEFYAGGVEYSYEISADDGTVLESDIDRD